MILTEADLRRKNKTTSALSESLLPIPGTQLYEQIIKKHQNNDEKFKEELEVYKTVSFSPFLTLVTTFKILAIKCSLFSARFG